MKFPRIVAENLNKDEVIIPENLNGNPKLLIVAFQQWHQKLVDSWVPAAESLMKQYLSFDFYELPTIRQMNFVYRRFLDGGMRAGIPSKDTRRRTITLYIDKDQFKESLDILTEETIVLFLVDRDGNIIWRDEGGFTGDKAKALSDAVRQVHSDPGIQ